MYSINRLFFFSLGSVCFLLVPVFWLSLALDFSALENFVVKLSTTEFVGYPIPELLGSTKGENVVDQVLRIKVFFTVLIVAYSLLFIGLSYFEGATRRIRFCARGISIPLFCLILGFWLKFIHDDHIISKLEKKELFQYTIIFLVISVLFFAYSFHSKKKVKPTRFTKATKNESTKPSPEVEGVAGKPPTDNEAPSTGEEVPTPESTLPPPLPEEAPVPEPSLPPPLPEEAPVPESSLPPPLPEEAPVPESSLPPPLPEEAPVPEAEVEEPHIASEEEEMILPPFVEEETEEEVPTSESSLPPPLPEEPPVPEAEVEEPGIASEEEMILPPFVEEEKEEEVPTSESSLPPPLPEEAPVPEDKSVLPPPISSLLTPLEEEPAVSTESIAESYKFPSESEESPENQSEDSSLDAEAENTEELKPPPF